MREKARARTVRVQLGTKKRRAGWAWLKIKRAEKVATIPRM